MLIRIQIKEPKTWSAYDETIGFIEFLVILSWAELNNKVNMIFFTWVDIWSQGGIINSITHTEGELFSFVWCL